MADQLQSVGADSVAIQVTGDNVVVSVGTCRLTLVRRHRAKVLTATTERDLLLTELRAIDLVGRNAELADLWVWLDDPRPITVRSLIGRAGSGKTRLAIELCEQAEAAGWTAGFATQVELQRFLDAQSLDAWRWQRPTLIVVDYAAASQGILRTWLEVLARRLRKEREGPLRLLLLERHAAQEHGWWSELISPGGMSGRGPHDLADPPEPIALPVLAAAEDRRAVLRQTASLAAAISGRAYPPMPPPGVDREFDDHLGLDGVEAEPLFLMMAGIIGATTGVPMAMALPSSELAHRIAMSERHRLIRLSRSWGFDAAPGPSKLVHLTACLTLQGGCDSAATIALVREEWDAMGWPIGSQAEWVAGRLGEAFYRQGGGANGVQPDLIGEAFLLRALADGELQLCDQALIVGRAWHRNRVAVTETLIHTIQDFSDGDTNHASLAWFDHISEKVPGFDGLRLLAFSLPENTLVLRARAAAITVRVAHSLDDQQEDNPTRDGLYAATQHALGRRLHALGQYEAALAAARKAVVAYRMLVVRRPDDFRASLAMPLGTLADSITDFDEHDNEALDLARESVALYRALACQYSAENRRGLASSLIILADTLGMRGDYEDAVASAREAVDICRALVCEQPNAFRTDLIKALNIFGWWLKNVGNSDAAVSLVREALNLTSAQAAWRPDEFSHQSAWLRMNLAVELNSSGEYGAATAAARESVEDFRGLAVQLPTAFQPALARSLRTLGEALRRSGEVEAGLTAAREAVELCRNLAAREPMAFRHALVRSLTTLAEVQIAAGDGEAAIAAAQEVVDIQRNFAAKRPPLYRSAVAESLNFLFRILHAARKVDAALVAAGEATDIARVLLARDAARFGKLLVFSLGNLAQALTELGAQETSVAIMREETKLVRALADQEPNLLRYYLACSLYRLGYVLLNTGKPIAALQPMREVVEIFRSLSMERPRSFSYSLTKCLVVHSWCLEAAGYREYALVAGADAITALMPAFLDQPRDLEEFMRETSYHYMARCERYGVAPDHRLLAPVVEMLAKLQASRGIARWYLATRLRWQLRVTWPNWWRPTDWWRPARAP